MTKTLDDIWAEIHYSEDSIPSIRAGYLTDDTRQEILQWTADLLPDKRLDKYGYSENEYDVGFNSAIQLIENKLRALGWKG